ncbi:MAG: hypothetical protein AB7O54_13460 [Pseudomonadales bacterium]
MGDPAEQARPEHHTDQQLADDGRRAEAHRDLARDAGCPENR